MISYDKLFDLFKERGISTYKIRKHKMLGQGTMTALKSGKGGLDRNTINRLCKYFDCQPGDLMEYIPDPETPWQVINPETGEMSNADFDFDLSKFKPIDEQAQVRAEFMEKERIVKFINTNCVKASCLVCKTADKHGGYNNCPYLDLKQRARDNPLKVSDIPDDMQ